MRQVYLHSRLPPVAIYLHATAYHRTIKLFVLLLKSSRHLSLETPVITCLLLRRLMLLCVMIPLHSVFLHFSSMLLRSASTSAACYTSRTTFTSLHLLDLFFLSNQTYWDLLLFCHNPIPVLMMRVKKSVSLYLSYHATLVRLYATVPA